jgi:hypothetical protein
MRAKAPQGFLINMGGAIFAGGRAWTVGIAGPKRNADNAPPLTQVSRHDLAISTRAFSAEVSATPDEPNEPSKANVVNAGTMKAHTMLMIGYRDLEPGNVRVRVHGKGSLGAKKRDEVVADHLAAINERRA